MENTKLLSALLNASIAAFCNSLPMYLWTSLAQGFSPAVAVLMAQLLSLSTHTKQQREGRLKQKLAHTQTQVDSCNSGDWSSSSSLQAAVTLLVHWLFAGSWNWRGRLLVELCFLPSLGGRRQHKKHQIIRQSPNQESFKFNSEM